MIRFFKIDTFRFRLELTTYIHTQLTTWFFPTYIQNRDLPYIKLSRYRYLSIQCVCTVRVEWSSPEVGGDGGARGGRARRRRLTAGAQPAGRWSQAAGWSSIKRVEYWPLAIKKTYAENIDKENGKMAQRRHYSREGIKKIKIKV